MKENNSTTTQESLQAIYQRACKQSKRFDPWKLDSLSTLAKGLKQHRPSGLDPQFIDWLVGFEEEIRKIRLAVSENLREREITRRFGVAREILKSGKVLDKTILAKKLGVAKSTAASILRQLEVRKLLACKARGKRGQPSVYVLSSKQANISNGRDE